MTDAEFDVQAAAIAAELSQLDRAGGLAPHELIAASCRGSANPAALAWLAEGLMLERGSKVADLGSGLGGPSSWIAARYGCVVVALEPAPRAAVASASLFPLTVVNASSAAVPFRADAFDAALLLGVLSVVDDVMGVLREARRVGRRLGVLEYCSTTGTDVRAGGSRFPPAATLADKMASVGWLVEQSSPMPITAPRSWALAVDKVDVPATESENEVAAAIEAGSIEPHLMVASR